MKMKKKKIIAVVLLVFAVAVVVCGGIYLSKKITENNPGELLSFDIQVAAENKSKIVHIYYPYYIYELSYGDAAAGEHGGLVRKEIAHNIRNKEISAEALKKLIESVESMQQDPSSETNQAQFDKRNYSYKVDIHFRKEKFKGNSVTATGYYSLPDCWPEFTEIINAILGTDALDANPKLLKFSNEWYKEAFAIDDSAFEYGSFDDMVRSQNLGMADIIGDRRWYPMKPVAQYQAKFTALSGDEIDRLVARKIEVTDSTEEEFIEFVKNYLTAIGEPDYPLENYFIEKDGGIKSGVICNTVETIMIFRSCEWQPEMCSDGTYAYIETGGPEGMVCNYPVFYSPDGKYILAIITNQEKYYKAFGLMAE